MTTLGLRKTLDVTFEDALARVRNARLLSLAEQVKAKLEHALEALIAQTV